MDVKSLKNIRGCNICNLWSSTGHTDGIPSLLRPPPGLHKWSNHTKYQPRTNPQILSICVGFRSTTERLTQSQHNPVVGAGLSCPPSSSRDAVTSKGPGKPCVQPGLGDRFHTGTPQLNTIPAKIKRETAQICMVLNYMMKRNRQLLPMYSYMASNET